MKQGVTRITGRKWSENQRQWRNVNHFTTEQKPESTYKENGVTVKKYRPGYASGVAPQRTVWSPR